MSSSDAYTIASRDNLIDDFRGSYLAASRRSKPKSMRLQTLQRTILRGPADRRSLKETFDVWLINEGGRKTFFGVWIFLHLLVAGLGFINYRWTDTITNARAVLGITYCFSRTAALMLNVDLIIILLPVCRNFVSLLRRTPLNGIIPFDNNIALHKATGWSMVAAAVQLLPPRCVYELNPS